MHDANDVDPMPEPNGAEILDALAEWYGRFIRVTFSDDLSVMSLWTAHTYLINELRTTPRLRFDSILPDCGKSTALDHLKALCYDPMHAALLSSPALIPRMLESGMRTILLDEIEKCLDPDRPGVKELLAIMNSGYRYGATRPVLVPNGRDWVPKEMSTYAPIAMAGNSPNLPADTVSRELRIILMPDLDGVVEDSEWEEIDEAATTLRSRVTTWTDSVRDKVKGMKVDLPDGCVSRMKEKWKPLMRVAVAAGGNWPDVVYRLATDDIARAKREKEAGLKTLPPGMVLFMDLYSIWPKDENFVPTETILTKLIDKNKSYWGEDSPYGKPLTAKRLGILISNTANVTSHRIGGQGPHGYSRSHLELAWIRLGIAPLGTSGKPGESGASGAKTSGSTGSTGSTASQEEGERSGADTDDAGLTDLTGCTDLTETPMQSNAHTGGNGTEPNSSKKSSPEPVVRNARRRPSSSPLEPYESKTCTDCKEDSEELNLSRRCPRCEEAWTAVWKPKFEQWKAKIKSESGLT